MVYFKYSAKQRKQPSMLRWVIYAVLIIVMLFIFIPRFLIYKAYSILEQEIPESKNTADSLPSKTVFVAYNYLQVAKFFPTGENKAKEGQKMILDFYFPLFKEDYNKLKYVCVDHAIVELKKDSTICADSINIKALEFGWRKYPDPDALEDFRQKWDTYHKYFSRSLLDYPRFIDAKHL